MATAEDFKFYAIANSVQVTRGAETIDVSRPKLYCVYEGLSLKFMLQFGRGTDDTTQLITAVFRYAVNNLDQLYILTTFLDAKPVQYLT